MKKNLANGAIRADQFPVSFKSVILTGLIVLLVSLLGACAATERKPLPEQTSVPITQPPEETPHLVIYEPLPEPTEKPITENEIFIVDIEGTKYRSRPVNEEINVLGMLSVGTKVLCVEDSGEFLLVELEDGQQVWIDAWYLHAQDDTLAAKLAEAALQSRSGRETFQQIEGEPVFQCEANLLNCRAEPNPASTILCQIVPGTRLTVYGKDCGFYLCRLPNGKLCYCAEEWISDAITYVEYPGAVDLRVFLPEAEFDLLFASCNNITGKAMYPAIPILEQGTAEMLFKAYQRFLEDGYAIKIYDAYRPLSAQIKLFDIVQDLRFIADPSKGYSWHQRGRAVDMSLIDLSTGKELVMPTPMHTFSMEAARTKSSEWSEEARNNVEYMTRVMREAGFGTIPTEWWHFENTSYGGILDADINLYTLPQYPVSEVHSDP